MTGLDGGSDPLAHLEVGMGFITLGVQQQSTGSGDRGDDVHVPPRAEPLGVPRQTLRQPDRVGGAEGAGQLRFHLFPRHARVAAEVELHGVGDEYRALTVDLHAPALVNHVRVDDRHPRRLGNDPADVLIEIPLRPPLGAPPVEHPVHRGHRPVGSMHEGRPDIPHPGVIQWRLDDLDAVRQIAVGNIALSRMNDHGHGFELGHRVGHRSPGASRLVLILSGLAQGVPVTREGHPDPFLRCVFGGHPVVHAGAIGHLWSPLIVVVYAAAGCAAHLLLRTPRRRSVVRCRRKPGRQR